jgi:hypothetical protein
MDQFIHHHSSYTESVLSHTAMPKVELKLNPEAVRRRAASIPGCREVPHNSSSVDPIITTNVCSFLVGCQGEVAASSSRVLSNPFLERKVSDLARVTIYCDTGTVATGRVLNGCVRHTFRKNVTSLDVVERCLRHPAELPVIGWDLAGQNDPADKANSVASNFELIEVGVAILGSEREKLVQHVKSLESSILKNEDKEKSSATHTATTGMEFQFSLAAGPMKHVDQCLNDINQMGKFVRWVATNGVGTVFLYGNGGVAYTPNIPQSLYHRLSQLRVSKIHATRPNYVSLGSKDRYFVSFYDGTFNYSKGPKGIDRELKKLTTPPMSVAFGSSYDAFFIVFHDGTYKYQGRGIPSELATKLSAQKELSLLSIVNLGPSGEWFLRSQDGLVGWGGVSDEMHEAIQELLDEGHSINFLDFGENGSYFVSYD